MPNEELIQRKAIISAMTTSGIAAIASINPGLAAIFATCQAFIGLGMNLRQDRVIEWAEWMMEHPENLTDDVVNSPGFKEGCIFYLEQYLRERNEKRRAVMRKIFLGFAQSKDKNNFPLERYYHALSQLSSADIDVLKNVDIKRDDSNYQIFGNTIISLISIQTLIQLGLLLTDTESRIGPVLAPFVKISPFGKDFISFLVE